MCFLFRIHPFPLLPLFLFIVFNGLQGSPDGYDDAFVRNKVFPMAAAAFGGEKSINSCLDKAFANKNLIKQFTVDSNYDDGIIKCARFQVSCFLALSHDDKAIIVSFRGTNQKQAFAYEIWTGMYMVNANVSGRKQPEMIGMPFGSLHELLEEDYMPVLLDTVAKYPDYELWFTGQSLGGALATVSAYAFCHKNVQLKSAKLITFGQPRTGDRPFAEWLNQKMSAIYRVTHANDAVVRIPLDIEHVSGFTHAGTEIFYDNDMSSANFETCQGTGDSDQCGIIKAHGTFIQAALNGLKDDTKQLVESEYNKIKNAVIAGAESAKKFVVNVAKKIGGAVTSAIRGLGRFFGISLMEAKQQYQISRLYDDHVHYFGHQVSDWGLDGCK